jgi:hypothetical protein
VLTPGVEIGKSMGAHAPPPCGTATLRCAATAHDLPSSICGDNARLAQLQAERRRPVVRRPPLTTGYEDRLLADGDEIYLLAPLAGG